jgi:hypothetical protein
MCVGKAHIGDIGLAQYGCAQDFGQMNEKLDGLKLSHIIASNDHWTLGLGKK